MTILCLVLSLVVPHVFGQTNVITAKTSNGNISTTLSFTGETKPIIETYAAADVSGPIQKILVEDGMKVEAGQALALIEKIRFSIALRQSTASLKLAKQNHKEKKKNFARNKKLFNKGAITQKVFDAIETELVRAESNFELEKAKHDRAQLDINRCTIIAPVTGYFVNRSIDPGQAVQRGQNVGQVIQLKTIYVEAKISDSDINKIKIGQKCLIEKKYVGTIMYINLYADKSRSFKVRISVPNPDIYFKANMFVKGEITLKQYENIPLFPSKAIRTEDEQYYVYLNLNGKAKKQQIAIIAQSGEQTYATEITKNAELVIVGQDQLSENMPIVVKNITKTGNSK